MEKMERLETPSAGIGGPPNVKDLIVRMANQLGKVYICGKCGSQVIVTKGGAGALKCCGAPMEQKK